MFASVVEQGSFRGAADVMGMSECSVSHHVAAFERELGHMLFERRRGTVGRLSVRGDATYARVRDLLTAAAALFDGDRQTTRRRLRVFAEPSLDDLLGAPIVRAAAVMPTIDVLLTRATFEEIVEANRQQKLDLAFHLGEPVAELDSRPAWHEPLRFFASAKHPLARMRRVTPAELRQYPLILPPEGSNIRRLVMGELRKIGCHDAALGPMIASHDRIAREVVLGSAAVAPCFGRSFQADRELGRIVCLPLDADIGLDVRLGFAPAMINDASAAALGRFLAAESARMDMDYCSLQLLRPGAAA